MRGTLKEFGPATGRATVTVSRAAAQSFTSAAIATVTFDTRVTDPLGMWDGATGLIVPFAGIWDIFAVMAFATGAAGLRGGLIQKNGGSVNASYHQANTTDIDTCPVSVLGQILLAGDKITLQGIQTSGGALNSNGNTALGLSLRRAL